MWERVNDASRDTEKLRSSSVSVLVYRSSSVWPEDLGNWDLHYVTESQMYKSLVFCVRSHLPLTISWCSGILPCIPQMKLSCLMSHSHVWLSFMRRFSIVRTGHILIFLCVSPLTQGWSVRMLESLAAAKAHCHTDLESWLYQKSGMGCPSCEPLLTYAIYTCYLHITVSQCLEVRNVYKQNKDNTEFNKLYQTKIKSRDPVRSPSRLKHPHGVTDFTRTCVSSVRYSVC